MGLATVKTDIKGFDTLLGGGIPKGSSLLIAGPPGTGKTLMTLEYTFNQARKGDRVLFVSTCELLYAINKFASTMSFFDLGLIHTGVNLDFYSPREEGGFVEFWDYSLGTILEGEYAGDIFDVIQEKVSAHRIDHLIIDTITSIELFLGDDVERRKKLLSFMGWVSRSGCTTILTGEPSGGMERLLADGIVDLRRVELPGREGLGVSVKAMEVVKLRGQAHSSGRYLYSISTDGIDVLAPGTGSVPEGDTAKTGVEGLDENIVGMPYGSAWHFKIGDKSLYRPLVDAVVREAIRSGDSILYISTPSDDFSLESFKERFGPEGELKGRLVVLNMFGGTVADKLKDRVVTFGHGENEKISQSVKSHLAKGKRCRIFMDVGCLESSHGIEEVADIFEASLSQAREHDNVLITYNGPSSGASLNVDALCDGVVDIWDHGGYALLQVTKAPYAKSFEPFVIRCEKGKIRLTPV